MSSETIKTLDTLKSMSIEDMMASFSKIYEIQEITDLLYLVECHIFREGAKLPPEAKIMFCVGDLGVEDLRMCKNFDGLKVRNKVDNYVKAPEIPEVMAEISGYVEGKPNHSAETLFSEIADVFYNLFHLIITDPDYSLIYKKWIEYLSSLLGLSVVQIGYFVLAKYKFRFINNIGKYKFSDENEEICKVIQRIGLPPTKAISDLYNGLDLLKKTCLMPRLQQLRGEYIRDHGLLGQAYITLEGI